MPLYFCNCLRRLADVLLLQRLDVELVHRFEHAVQRLLEPGRRLGRVHQRLERIGQLADRAHADFVPAEIILLQRGENLLGRFVRRILQQAREQQVLEQRAIFRPAAAGLKCFRSTLSVRPMSAERLGVAIDSLLIRTN